MMEESSGEEPYRYARVSPRCCVTGPRDEVTDCTPMQQLEEFLDGYRYAQSWPSLDQPEDYTLWLDSLVITRPMITLLRPLLLCDEASSSVSKAKSRFSEVTFWYSCHFCSEADVTTPDDDEVYTLDDVCTPDDKVCLLSALPRCNELDINYCPEIVSALLNIPEIDHLEAKSLRIVQHEPLTDLEYTRLGDIIAKSGNVTALDLRMIFADVPQAFFASFVNYIHIQSMRMHFIGRITDDQSTDDPLHSSFSKMVANDHGTGALEQLLGNPQNQLKKLKLEGNGLEDHHFMAIADLLLISHIEEIDLTYNNIKAPGLLEFARQLPNMHSLNNIFLGLNPWKEASLEVLEECGAALLDSLIENPSIQFLHGMDKFPQCRLLWHYCSLNYGGRKLLTSACEQPIPDGLWPRVLSRAGRGKKKVTWTNAPINNDDYGEYHYNGPANAVYFFLRNCPKIFSWQESLSVLQKDALVS